MSAVRPAFVVEAQVGAQVGLGLGDAVIGLEVHLFVFHALPQPLDEDVVAPAALAVHADLDAVVFEQVGEIGAGELASLIGVEDLRAAVAMQRFAHRIEAEVISLYTTPHRRHADLNNR
ncbi:hypothetical protein ebA5509 [Aromatoleum aromaticum EbN1]|uniref:Uncharacterized protein n=1 Tax=Aromatoleum aromaticum (strain DSM 19018 / LMG 30748 / EbN1) TaxID=76114 RepID=Q5P0A2_AROAE|nr:hypothetical protein ebA5509 [Aromatoleum aromaticum EbN1]